MDGHPVKSKTRWEAKAIPLLFYGDEVPVVGVGKVWSRCVLMFEWFSFLFWRKLCVLSSGKDQLCFLKICRIK